MALPRRGKDPPESAARTVCRSDTLAPDTGGFCFPLRSELQSQLGQAMQVFGSRYLVRWAPMGAAQPTAPIEVTVKRKGTRVIAPALTAAP